jgi:hypothetical protein
MSRLWRPLDLAIERDDNPVFPPAIRQRTVLEIRRKQDQPSILGCHIKVIGSPQVLVPEITVPSSHAQGSIKPIDPIACTAGLGRRRIA